MGSVTDGNKSRVQYTKQIIKYAGCKSYYTKADTKAKADTKVNLEAEWRILQAIVF